MSQSASVEKDDEMNAEIVYFAISVLLHYYYPKSFDHPFNQSKTGHD